MNNFNYKLFIRLNEDASVRHGKKFRRLQNEIIVNKVGINAFLRANPLERGRFVVEFALNRSQYIRDTIFKLARIAVPKGLPTDNFDTLFHFSPSFNACYIGRKDERFTVAFSLGYIEIVRFYSESTCIIEQLGVSEIPEAHICANMLEHLVVHTLASALLWEDVFYIPSFRQLFPEPVRFRAERRMTQIDLFVLFHEFGHAIDYPVDDEVTPIFDLNRNQMDEIVSDVRALYMSNFSQDVIIGGVIFMDLLVYYEAIVGYAKKMQSNTHPSAKIRRIAINNIVERYAHGTPAHIFSSESAGYDVSFSGEWFDRLEEFYEFGKPSSILSRRFLDKMSLLTDVFKLGSEILDGNIHTDRLMTLYDSVFL